MRGTQGEGDFAAKGDLSINVANNALTDITIGLSPGSINTKYDINRIDSARS